MDIFPRLTGILSAGAELQAYFESRGVTPEELTRAEVEELLDATPAGRKIIDIGRMLSEVEIRTPNGRSVEFASIAFIDEMETLRVGRELMGSAGNEISLVPSGAPRYAVSATLRKGGPFSRRERRRDRQRWQ
jgi:hypothetical protein